MVSQSDLTTTVAVISKSKSDKNAHVGASLLQIALYRLRRDKLTIWR